LFLFITAPVSAHFLAKAARHQGLHREIPPSKTGRQSFDR
jgi:multisubunit Na+/H+ antiporter MnhG subunit